MSENEAEQAAPNIELDRPGPETESRTAADAIGSVDRQLGDIRERVKTPEQIAAVQAERERQYRSAVDQITEQLGDKVSPESFGMVRQKMVDESMDAARRDNERFDELRETRAALQISEAFGESQEAASARLEKLKGIMDRKDLAIMLDTMEQNPDLFSPEGKFLHATNTLAIDNILETGKLSGGLWQKGPSLTDGNSETALTFDLVWEDLKTSGGLDPARNPKRLNSGKYFDKKKDFLDFQIKALRANTPDDGAFAAKRDRLLADADKYYRESWQVSVTEQKFDEDLKSKLYGQLLPQWKKDGLSPQEIGDRTKEVLQRAEIFRKQFTAVPSPEAVDDMYPMTLVLDQAAVDLGDQSEVSELQSTFEVRPDGEVGLEKVGVIFVPAAKIQDARRRFGSRYPAIKIRSSEELEAVRLLKKAGEAGG